jgi:hypothetical protein
MLALKAKIWSESAAIRITPSDTLPISVFIRASMGGDRRQVPLRHPLITVERDLKAHFAFADFAARLRAAL